MTVRKHGCGFSVQLKSKDFVKSLSVSHDGRRDVLIEGVLGELDELEVIEGSVLRIKGTSGTLLVDLAEGELRKALSKKRRET